MRVVIDHVAGMRRGQRQEFPSDQRVRFGRHPECEVSFDAHRDIDASSRHAELRPRVTDPVAGGVSPPAEAGWVLVDVGSSNGTYVEGHRITEAPVAPAVPLDVEFGPGGPRVRLFLGDDEAIERLPPAKLEVRRPSWVIPAAVAAIAVVLIGALALRC